MNEQGAMEFSAITLRGKTYTLDNNGFLFPSEQWDENFAEGMAEKLGIKGGLTEEHWDFIHYLRKKFLEEETVPFMVYACADNNLRLRKFRSLFPTGYHRGACKIAGINYEFMYNTSHWLTYETSPIITYETTPITKSEYKVTPLGFLEDFNQWDENFALFVMREWKLPEKLSEKHRSIINFLRDYYKITTNIPTVCETCITNNIKLEELRELFPGGYRRGACRMAGLPFFA